MVMNKDYFVSRLANGESIDKIGEEIAELMNVALEEHNARLAAEKAEADRLAALQEQEETKRELAAEMAAIIQDWAVLEGEDPADFELAEGEVDQLVALFTETFATLRNLKKMLAALDTTPATAEPKRPLSDDEVLGNFLKTLF